MLVGVTGWARLEGERRDRDGDKIEHNLDSNWDVGMLS